jgi:glutathione S-transferase
LWEKGLEFVDRPVDSTKREHLSDWYLKLNPNGVVPTLIHDGAVIVDSSVIMEYLDEVFPEHSFRLLALICANGSAISKKYRRRPSVFPPLINT